MLLMNKANQSISAESPVSQAFTLSDCLGCRDAAHHLSGVFGTMPSILPDILKRSDGIWRINKERFEADNEQAPFDC